jgi:hypothetical protein
MRIHCDRDICRISAAVSRNKGANALGTKRLKDPKFRESVNLKIEHIENFPKQNKPFRKAEGLGTFQLIRTATAA